MNEHLQAYIKQIVDQTEITSAEKKELESEIGDHLLLLTEEYILKGYTEEEAVKMAIQVFALYTL
ncbi:MAG TPA: permease prefix domain 1-containing protein [Bacillus sp. (in: firmicutes)]|nr:permease prefix domain 1-containing protein [Bacillus sp. (in: firmicutes)]